VNIFHIVAPEEQAVAPESSPSQLPSLDVDSHPTAQNAQITVLQQASESNVLGYQTIVHTGDILISSVLSTGGANLPGGISFEHFQMNENIRPDLNQDNSHYDMGANDPLDGSDAVMELDAPPPVLEQGALDRNDVHLAEENRRTNTENSNYVLNGHDCFVRMSEGWKRA